MFSRHVKVRPQASQREASSIRIGATEALLRKIHPAQEVLEAGVGAEGVKLLLVHVLQHPEIAGDFHNGENQAVI